MVKKLILSHIYSGYDSIEVINDLNLTLDSGDIFAIMGKNGMGKTTLLKTILGIVSTMRGDIKVDNQTITGKSPAQLIAYGIGYAPQEQALFQDLSIVDNLRLALKSDKQLALALERVELHFPFILSRLKQKAGTLSGGEQKMLILARALMLEPKLILIDEISEGLQPSVIQRIAETLKKERIENNLSILMVEQHLDFALSIANKWAVLKNGAIDDSGLVNSTARQQIIEHLTI